MSTDGIEGLLFETHNWGKTVAFWQGLGYVLEMETGHNSGQLRHPSGGPYIFVAERPPTQPLKVVPAVAVKDAQAFSPPPSATVIHPFEAQHWPGLQMMLADPDGRELGVNAPLPAAPRKASRG